MAESSAKLVLLGSLNMDLVVRSPSLPRPGETLIGGPFQTFHGGKGANQAVAAARLGADVALLGRVGDDAHGRELTAGLAGEGVDVSGVLAVTDEPTGVALITVDDRGENTIVVASGANGRFMPEDLTDESRAVSAIENAEWLVAQLECPLDTVAAAAARARSAGVRVMLNAAPAAALPASLLSCVDVLVVNRVEAAQISGRSPEDDPALLARALEGLGPSVIVVTLGDQGALLLEEGRLLRQDAFQVEPVDAVAAGDAVVGALATAFLGRRSRAEALAFACAAGAVAATRPGAQASLPTRAILDAFMDGFESR